MAKSQLFRGQIKKLKKADPPKSGHSLRTTEPVFILSIIWYGLVTPPQKCHNNNFTPNDIPLI